MNKFLKYHRLLFTITCICLSIQISAQTDSYTVIGTVVDQNDAALHNILVSIEGQATSPILTKTDGSFEIKTPGGNAWLLISSSGEYKAKRIYLNYRDHLRVTLIPIQVKSIHDEVISPIGPQHKRDITGAVENIQMNKVHEQPVQTINQYLIGSTPGLLVYNHSGMPGDGTYTYMRGIRSLYTNNQPLMISDGIPLEEQGIFTSLITGYNYDPLTSVDPQNVTSLSILKDAAITTNYGLKSSNGVIFIETLKPTETRTSIDFSARTGFSMSPKQIPVLDNSQYRTLAHEILLTSNYMEEDYDYYFPGLFTNASSSDYYRYQNNTNWQDEVFRNALISDVGLTIKGGDAISKYGLSVGYQGYDGIIKNTNYNSIKLRFVGSFNVFRWLELKVSTSLNNNRSTLKESGISTATNPIFTSLFKSPVLAPYEFDEDGQELTFLDNVEAFGVSNPTAVITRSEAYNKNYKFLGAYSLVGDITNNLKWNSLLGLNFGNMKEGLFLPGEGMEPYYDQQAYNEVRQEAAYIKSMYFDNYFSYHMFFNQRHNLTARAGLKINTNHSEIDFGQGYNTPSDEYKSLRFASPILAQIGGNIGNWNRMSLFGNLDYKFEDKYMVALNLSLDGSSRTGDDAETPLTLFSTPFGAFYSLSGAWRISSEQFLRDISTIDELKLRISYGLSGNDDIGNFNAQRYYTQINFRETTGVILGTNPVTDLKYEEVHMFNLGLDYSMLGEKLNISFDFFSSLTKDMLIYERQEDYIGYTYRPANGGELKNSGLELGITGRIISTADFKLDAGFNVSGYKNKVISIKGDSLITNIPGGEIISKPGYPVNSFYGLVAEGVFSTKAEAQQANLVNDIGLPYEAGDIRYADRSGDGVINELDKTIIGSPNPAFFGGFTLSASYRQWSMSSLLQFVVGNDSYNYLRYKMEQMTNLNNQSASVLNRWQYDGQVTDIPRAAWDDPMNNSAFSNRWIENGSYMRIKNITLSYNVPDKFLIFDNARFFATVMNAFTFTKYLGYDPEFSYSSDQLLLGVDYGLLPQSTTFLLGVKFGL